MMRRALVLGGGGITCIAWELGMLAGLAGHGVDLRDAGGSPSRQDGAGEGDSCGSRTPREVIEALLRVHIWPQRVLLVTDRGGCHWAGAAAGALGRNSVTAVLPSITAAASSVSRWPWLRA